MCVFAFVLCEKRLSMSLFVLWNSVNRLYVIERLLHLQHSKDIFIESKHSFNTRIFSIAPRNV